MFTTLLIALSPARISAAIRATVALPVPTSRARPASEALETGGGGGFAWPGVSSCPALAWGTAGFQPLCRPHLTETTARPFVPHPPHRTRALRSRTLA